MGDRVRALGADMTRAEHARALVRFEEVAEALLEDEANGAEYTGRITVKASKRKGSIPRGAARLMSEGPVVIPFLIAEIRRRDVLLRRAIEALENNDVQHPISVHRSASKAIRDFLAED